PASGLGFEATGGTAVLEVLAGTAGTGTINAPNITVRATGDARMMFSDLTPPAGGEQIQGDGGTGQGGTAIVAVSAGALTTGQMLLEATGIGGASAPTPLATAFQSGDGIGGTSHFTQAGGATTVATLDVVATGRGGGGSGQAGF